MEDSVFFGVTSAFFAGIFFRSYIEISVTLLAAFIGALIVAAIFFRSRRIVFVGCAVGLSFCFGSLRTHLALSGAHPLDSSVGASISLDGSICSDPKTAGFSTSFCFSPKGSSDRIMVRISRGRDIFFGDDVAITGVLEFPKSDPSFDYRSYLLKDGVRYVMQKAKVLKSGTNSDNPIVTTFLNMKHVILRQIDILLEKPYAGILEGMLLGDRSAISADIMDDFRRSGLIHVVILSGYSMAIISGSIVRATSFLGRRASFVTSACVIVAFTLLTGAATVTVRAAIMAIVSLSIRTAGRKYAPLRALTFALGIMVVINPLILAFDAAFQISVSSVVGLVLLSEPISRKIGFISERWGMREIVSATLSTQIFSMPLIMFYMGEVSVISIIPNIVLLPFLPWILLLGVVLLVLGFFGAAAGVPAAAPFAWVMKFLLSYVLWTVQSYGSLPFSSIKMTVGPFGLTVMFAFVFVFTIWLRRNCSRTSAN